jgi:hypothetical protein
MCILILNDALGWSNENNDNVRGYRCIINYRIGDQIIIFLVAHSCGKICVITVY